MRLKPNHGHLQGNHRLRTNNGVVRLIRLDQDGVQTTNLCRLRWASLRWDICRYNYYWWDSSIVNQFQEVHKSQYTLKYYYVLIRREIKIVFTGKINMVSVLSNCYCFWE